MVECIRQLKNTFVLIPYPSDYNTEIIFPRQHLLRRKNRIVVFNDLQKFFEPGKDILKLIDKIKEQDWHILANCRTVEEWETVKRLWGISSNILEPIEIPEVDENFALQVAALNGIPLPSYFDRKNIGTIFVNLDEMRLRYNSKISNTQKQILIAIKKLLFVGVNNSKGEILLSSIKELTGLLPLQLTDPEWLDNLTGIIEKGFVSGSHLAVVPEQVYFDLIIEPQLSIGDIINDIIKISGENNRVLNKLIYSAETSEKAIDIIREFQKASIKLDVYHYNIAIAKQKSEREGKRLLDEMIKKGIPPDVVTYTTLIHLCKDYNLAVALKTEMIKKGITPDVVTYNTLLEKAENEGDTIKWIIEFCSTDLIPNARTAASLEKAIPLFVASSRLNEMFDMLLRFNPILFFSLISNFDIDIVSKFILEFPTEIKSTDFNKLGFVNYYLHQKRTDLAKNFLDIC